MNHVRPRLSRRGGGVKGGKDKTDGKAQQANPNSSVNTHSFNSTQNQGDARVPARHRVEENKKGEKQEAGRRLSKKDMW